MLPALRHDLDIMPSPVPDRPGILMRDPMRYSDAVLIIPYAFGPALECFDGQHSELDLRAVGDTRLQLLDALRDSGFLDDEAFAKLRHTRESEFAKAAVREPAHAGSGYPVESNALNETMRGYIDRTQRNGSHKTIAIAAPHVSPFGGWQSYQAAYKSLPHDAGDCTFVILGTSHYGPVDKFGLTRKPFLTPLGETRPNTALIDRLSTRAGAAITEEDYCHSVEHSIEFQVLFLQWLYGPEISIVPILCGSFARSIYLGGKPEENDGVNRFIGELGEIAARADGSVTWVLGVDMAHIGRRYGDAVPAHAHRDHMIEVAQRDQVRNERVVAGDADGFWELVQQNRDDLRWCGSSPFYTFLKAVPGIQGTVERYEQWNIDESSVVSFAGISFVSL
jgi:AmmeMemoRadiSam system protein B